MHEHEEKKKWVQEVIAYHRDKLGLERKWKINVQILCSDSQERSALVKWIPDTYEATLYLMCDLSYIALSREVIHELVELSLYRSGTIIDQFARRGSRDIAEFFMSQYRIARNQEVEQIVSLYLGREEACCGTD